MPSTITYSAMASNSQLRSQRKSKMSVTQTYFLAHSARGKLSREAARPDHDLRLLVGHANMLDSLMLDIANAEQEQEKWFTRSVLGADAEEEDEQEVSISRPDTIMEEAESDWEVEDAEASDEESEDEEQELTLTRTVSHHSPPELTSDSDSDSDDDTPPSPENSAIDSISHFQRQSLVTSSYYEVKETAISETEEEEESFFLDSRSQPTIIAAY